MRALLVLGHAAVLAVLVAALLRWEGSVPAKILVGALGAGFFLLIVILHRQMEKLIEIHTTLRLIFISRETQRLDRRNRIPTIKILASDLEQEKFDEELRSQLSRRPVGKMAFLLGYVFAVVVLTFFVMMVWSS